MRRWKTLDCTSTLIRIAYCNWTAKIFKGIVRIIVCLKNHQLRLMDQEKGGEKDNAMLPVCINLQFMLLPAPSSFVYDMAPPFSMLLTFVITTWCHVLGTLSRSYTHWKWQYLIAARNQLILKGDEKMSLELISMVAS